MTPSSISSKIIVFFIFCGLEIICNTITFFSDLDVTDEKLQILQPGSINEPNMDIQYYITFAMIG